MMVLVEFIRFSIRMISRLKFDVRSESGFEYLLRFYLILLTEFIPLFKFNVVY